jgi:hypothetical protein
MFQRTATLWRRLTGKAASAAANVEEDRRTWVRFPCDLETRAEPTGRSEGTEQQRLAVRIRDVSQGGIALVANRPFAPGALLSVELPCAEGQPITAALACVVHVQAQGPGEWLLGCNFARELEDHDLEAFGAARARPSRPGDNRNWERFPAQIMAGYAPANGPDASWRTAPVVNVSVTGVALLEDEPLENGTLLTTELQAASGQTVTSLLACVVHVTAHPDGKWVAGCNFISELTEKDLDALLREAA